MKKNNNIKIILIIILSIIALGITTLMCLLLTNNHFLNFNVQNKSTLLYEKTYQQTPTEINLDLDWEDLNIKESNNDKIKIVIYGKDGSKASSTFENNILNINIKNKNYFCIGFCNYKDEVNLYLPKNIASTLNVNTKSGDINIDSFKNLSLNIGANSGNIKDSTITTHSGDIKITESNQTNLQTNSGDIKVIKTNQANLKTDSGDIEVNHITKSTHITTSSGEVNINKFTILKNSAIKTSSGDVSIKNITDSYINTTTSSGDVKVKHNDRYQQIELKINTSSGDITVQ